jgi:hypothetical protein
VDATDYDPIVVIGDIAHIEAASDSGPRANMQQSRKVRDEYDNLILLCKNCHARLDGQKRANTVDAIRQLRNDHEAWVRESLPERGLSTVAWKVVVLQGSHPVDVELARAALSPDFLVSDPEVITVTPSTQSWHAICHVLADRVIRLFTKSDPFDCRFAVFPLAPVSACIALGYLLTNRPHVRLFQYDRDARSWAWPSSSETATPIAISDLPAEPIHDTVEVAFCLDFSARISEDVLTETGIDFARVIHVSVAQPNTEWLHEGSQLVDLARSVRQLFEKCVVLYPKSSKWHLFCAVPAAAAVAIGQQINPTMSPLVQLYEFAWSAVHPYRPSILLGEDTK